MNDFEQTLNSILSSPEQMERILGIARSLSGEDNAGTPTTGSAESQQETPQGILGGLDPRTLGMLTRIMGEFSSQDGSKAALVTALKPFLREERYNSLAKALTVSKIVRAAKTAMSEMGGDKFV